MRRVIEILNNDTRDVTADRRRSSKEGWDWRVLACSLGWVPSTWSPNGDNQLRGTHGSFLIRRQRGHPGVVLPLGISNSANHFGRNAIRIEPN